MKITKPVSDCIKYCSAHPDIKNCETDCLSCQNATNDYILYNCHKNKNEKCKNIKFYYDCPVPIKEGFGYYEDKRDIQFLVTTIIILLFVLYLLKNKHFR